jgi:hypothetical protein
MLYSDRGTEDEQIKIRRLLRKKEKWEHGGFWNLKLNIL